MKTSLIKAMELILSGDAELLNILSVTAKMSLQSSVLALLLGLPIGIWLGACRFPGRNVLLVTNRTLQGMPPVVCGLLFYMLFSGVGPLRHLKLLYTVKIMIKEGSLFVPLSNGEVPVNPEVAAHWQKMCEKALLEPAISTISLAHLHSL